MAQTPFLWSKSLNSCDSLDNIFIREYTFLPIFTKDKVLLSYKEAEILVDSRSKLFELRQIVKELDLENYNKCLLINNLTLQNNLLIENNRNLHEVNQLNLSKFELANKKTEETNLQLQKTEKQLSLFKKITIGGVVFGFITGVLIN